MSKHMPKVLKFSPDGTCRFIHDDFLADLAREAGDLTIRRASHVEPTEDGRWTADLSPVGGPVLGPYVRRSAALGAELEWLWKNDVPVPEGS
jgi:hypothetical protein